MPVSASPDRHHGQAVARRSRLTSRTSRVQRRWRSAGIATFNYNPSVPPPSPYFIREYPLQQGALEIAYIEEFFNEFPTPKSAAEIMARLEGREYQILMAESRLDDGTMVPVSYKVSHELRAEEMDPKLNDLVA